jgi:hypothetical protein
LLRPLSYIEQNCRKWAEFHQTLQFLALQERLRAQREFQAGILLSQSGLCLWRRWSTLADVIAPAEAKVKALEEKRRMIAIERTDPQSV